jgi:hypothetical protein
MSIELAQAILKAAKLRDQSFDKQAAYESNNEAIDNGYGIVDQHQFYKKSLMDCAKKACHELYWPIYIMLHYSWNESIEWAEKNK